MQLLGTRTTPATPTIGSELALLRLVTCTGMQADIPVGRAFRAGKNGLVMQCTHMQQIP